MFFLILLYLLLFGTSILYVLVYLRVSQMCLRISWVFFFLIFTLKNALLQLVSLCLCLYLCISPTLLFMSFDIPNQLLSLLLNFYINDCVNIFPYIPPILSILLSTIIQPKMFLSSAYEQDLYHLSFCAWLISSSTVISSPI